jgi:hypothetical protein
MGIDLIAGRNQQETHILSRFVHSVWRNVRPPRCAPGEKSATSDGLLISACTTEQKIIGVQNKFGGLKHREVGGE